MSYHVITTRQLVCTVVGTVICTGVIGALATTFAATLTSTLDRPDVYRDPQSGRCLTVINYRHGDRYRCSDVDATLNRYYVVYVNPRLPELVKASHK